MKGRQIRWQNALRAGAVAAAAVAVIAALPSLLAPPTPSKPPADVGIATLPEPPPVTPPPVPEPALKLKPPMKKAKRGSKARPERPTRKRSRDRRDKKEIDEPVATAPIITSSPIYSPPPAREGFGFEP